MNIHETIKEYIYSHKDELTDILSSLVSVPSVKGEPAPDAPFGTEPKKALELMDGICAAAGLDTAVHDNVIGTADLVPGGYEGEPALGILCHLDVVPAPAENWETDPFAMTEKDGILYGRGVIDDKGPLAASFMALKCLKELDVPLKKSVRLIYGTDEENGSGDLELYLKNNRLPRNVFTPDGSFPVINIEKGMMRSRFAGEYGDGNIISFSGGTIPNAVPDKAECIAAGITPAQLSAALSAEESEAEFGFEMDDEDRLHITCTGRSAHASTPENGLNAVTVLLGLLSRMPLKEGKQTDIIRGLVRAFPHGQTDGENVGLKMSDERSGALTLVLSIFKMSEGRCEGCTDVRFPLCTELKAVEQAQRQALEKAGCRIESFIGDEPHETDSGSEFISRLLEVYERVEGKPGRCIAIGGGTYVHNVSGGIAFGAEREGIEYNMHGANENIAVSELLLDAVMYAEAVMSICG